MHCQIDQFGQNGFTSDLIQIFWSKYSITQNILHSILIGVYQHVFERNLALGLNSILVYIHDSCENVAFIGGISITTIEVI